MCEFHQQIAEKERQTAEILSRGNEMKIRVISMAIVAALALTGCNPDSLVGSQSDEIAVFVDGGSGHNVHATGGSGHNVDGGSGHN